MPSTIKLDEECTIYQAAQLRQQLADALIASDSLEVLEVVLTKRSSCECRARTFSKEAPEP